MKNLGLPIIISVTVHVMFIGLLIWGAVYFRPIQFTQAGGGGAAGVVGVWIAEEGNGSTLQRTKNFLPFAKRSAPSYSSLSAEGEHISEGQGGSVTSEEGDGEGSGGGTGRGTGSGAGIGGSPSGDPRLTKIWKRINDFKYYPQIAKRKGLEGMPKVTFAIAQDGKLNWVSIASSCGEATLDDAAMETVRRAAPYPFYPEPITLTVRYSLED